MKDEKTLEQLKAENQLLRDRLDTVFRELAESTRSEVEYMAIIGELRARIEELNS
jgi:hypothetical protein